jgi:tetratricopeptide (TPR) repeat protein
MDLAELVCRQAQLINRDYAPIYNTWGLVKLLRGDVIEALRFFERAIQLDPNLFEAQMNFGQITQSFRGYQDAQRAFARAVQLRADDYEAVIGLGAAHRGLAQYDQARAQYERAIQIAGTRPEAYFNLGILYQDYLGTDIAALERAKGYLRQFIDRAGDRPQYAETVQGVTRRCREPRQVTRGRRRTIVRRSDCKKGRLQTIDDIISAIREGEAMQREAESMQREAERMEREAAGSQ